MNTVETVLYLNPYKICKFNTEEFNKEVNNNPSLYQEDGPSIHLHYLSHASADLASLMTFSFSVYLDTFKYPIAYYSLSNIHIPVDYSITDRSASPDYYSFIPAVLLQNFFVLKKFRRSGHGSEILSIIKSLVLNNSISAARVIVADSLTDSIDFYLKNGFDFLSEKDTPPLPDDTTRMYFDLYDLT